jgi:hypothetical protein
MSQVCVGSLQETNNAAATCDLLLLLLRSNCHRLPLIVDTMVTYANGVESMFT